MATPTNPLVAPAANNVSPMTADDAVTAAAAGLGLTHVGARASGLPTGADGIDSLITKAYDLAARQPFRRKILFAGMASARATSLSHQGAVIQLNVVDDLDDDPTTALLQEDYDVLPTPLKSYGSNIILQEWGRTVSKTALARGTSMIPLDPVAAERVGRNMGATIERRAFNVAIAAGGVTAAGAVNNAVPTSVTVGGSPSDTLRAASESFKENDVEPIMGNLYAAVMSPANETALRKEADAAGWRYWQVNQEDGMLNGVARGSAVGQYEGFAIYVSSLVPDTTGCVFLGQDGLAVGQSTAPGFGAPQVVVAPVVDRLRRFASVGWFWLGDFARFRAEAILTGDLAASA